MHFTIKIDYKALKALKDKLIFPGKLLRRAKKIMEYDFNIVYLASSENIVPFSYQKFICYLVCLIKNRNGSRNGEF